MRFIYPILLRCNGREYPDRIECRKLAALVGGWKRIDAGAGWERERRR
jgi:hypothetical protein